MCPYICFYVTVSGYLYLEERIGEWGNLASHSPKGGRLCSEKCFWGLPVEPENNLYYLRKCEQGQRWKFLRAAVTKWHKQADWKEQKFILSYGSQKLKIKSSAGPCCLWNPSCLFPAPGGLLTIFGVPWLHHSNPPSSHGLLPVYKSISVSKFPLL